MAQLATIFIVDDDHRVRKGLVRLLSSLKYNVETFSSAQELLARLPINGPACIVLDVRLPDLGGLDLQAELSARKILTPIIFISGHGNIPMAVRAMKAGAVDFLTKPFKPEALLDTINSALQADAQRQIGRAEQQAIERRLQTLTIREREVFTLVVEGLLNKQIAAQLGMAEKTVKIHRAHMMHKMYASSVAELVRLAEKL